MCFTVAIVRSGVISTAEDYYNRPLNIANQAEKDVLTHMPDYFMVGGFEHPVLPVMLESSLKMCSWGLIPNNNKIENWESAQHYRKLTLNARAESIFEKPSYKDNIRQHRCLLPVSGFYEWRNFNGRKYPYYIYPEGANSFLIGSVYDSWLDKSTGITHTSFSMVTTAANGMMETIHNDKKRMPLILSTQNAQLWLQPQLQKPDIEALMQPYDEHYMRSHTISNRANNVKLDRNYADIMKPFYYPELSQQSLF